MPALPSDIIRATRRARIVTRTDSAIQSLFPGARDAVGEPEPGLFENAADAATVLDLKAVLTGTFRRRFVVSVADEVWMDPMTAIPTFTLIDGETGANGPVLLTRIEIDLESEKTSMEAVG